MSIPLKFQRLCGIAKLPRYSREGDACLDICSVNAVTIQPGTQRVIGTGLRVELPPGYEMQIRGRSGMALQHVWCFNGTIDSNYRGEILILLRNFADNEARILPGDRIAQLAVKKITTYAPVWADELTETTRGDAGFGSSGL